MVAKMTMAKGTILGSAILPRGLLNSSGNFTYEDLINERLNALTENSSQLANSIDTMWVFVTAVGILSMQTGFAMLEAGMLQVKNVRSILMKNLMDALLGCLVWYFVGFQIFQGSRLDAPGHDFLVSDSQSFGYFVQQFGFAITSVTIVSGAVCSRIKFGRYITFSVLQTGIIYPLAAHVAWSESGFLYKQGFVDFSGSGVVHGLGGVSAFVGAYFLGPRVGRFYEPEEGQKKGDVRPLPEHNIVLVVLGGLILFMGWFPFNAGSTGGLADPVSLEQASRAMLSTLLAASAGGSATTLYHVWFSPVHNIGTTVNGILAGLVSITGPCASVEPWASVIIGIGAGLIYLLASKVVLYKLHIDDPLHAFSVHGACGMYGIVMTGVFDIHGGVIYGHGANVLFVQLEGAVLLILWGATTAGLVFFLLTKLAGIRVSEHDQLVGLDILYHQRNAYPEFDSTSIREYNYTRAAMQNLQRRKMAARLNNSTDRSSGKNKRPHTSSNQSHPSCKDHVKRTGSFVDVDFPSRSEDSEGSYV